MPANLNFAPALPEIVLLASACVVLILDLFVSDARRAVSYWLAQAGLLATGACAVYGFHPVPVRVFGEMFVADALADLLKIVSVLIVILTLVYSRAYLAARGLFRGETFVLMMFALLGMMVMISAGSLADALPRARAACRCRSTRWSRCSATRRSRSRRR